MQISSLKRIFLKDRSQESSLESLFQVITVLVVLGGAWLFVFSRAYLTEYLGWLGIPTAFFGTPNVTDSISYVLDQLISLSGTLLNNWSEIAAFAGVSMWITYIGVPLAYAALLALSATCIANLRVGWAILVTALCVLAGSVLAETLATRGSKFHMQMDIQRAIQTEQRPSDWALLRLRREHPHWFDAIKTIDGKELKVAGILLICAHGKCIYIPATATDDADYGQIWVWNPDQGLGLLALGDGFAEFRINSGANTLHEYLNPHPVVSELSRLEHEQLKRGQLERLIRDGRSNYKFPENPVPIKPETAARISR